MDFFESIAAAAEQLARLPLRPEQAFFAPYLVCAVLVALGVYALRERGGAPRSLRGALRFCFPREIWRHPSARLDLRYLAVHGTLGVALLAPFALTGAVVAYHTSLALEGFFGEAVPVLPTTFATQALLALALTVGSDLGFYVSHRLSHRVDFLWEFHKVHHSAEVLTPFTSLRVHPVPQTLQRACMGVGAGLPLGVFDYFAAWGLDHLTLLGVNAFAVVFFAAVANLQHSHVWLSFGPRWGRIFVSPAHHQIHHSSDPRHAHKNFGATFAFWDGLAGSLYLPPRKPEALRFGLGGGEADYAGVLRLYGVPFARAARVLARQLRAFAFHPKTRRPT